MLYTKLETGRFHVSSSTLVLVQVLVIEPPCLIVLYINLTDKLVISLIIVLLYLGENLPYINYLI